VQDVIQVSLDIDVLGDIIFNEAKVLVPYEVGDILHVPGEEVIHADNLMSLLDKVMAEVRTQETRSTCDQCPLHGRCSLVCFFPGIIALSICKGNLFGRFPESVGFISFIWFVWLIWFVGFIGFIGFLEKTVVAQ
jgi:hypothetical protein